MSTNTKCRAEGGVANCTDPNCPEKRAFMTDLFKNDQDAYYAHLRVNSLAKAKAEENLPRGQRIRRAKAILKKFGA